MNKTFFVLASNALSITCVICSSYLIMNDKGGWGWILLLGAVATTVTHD